MYICMYVEFLSTVTGVFIHTAWSSHIYKEVKYYTRYDFQENKYFKIIVQLFESS